MDDREDVRWNLDSFLSAEPGHQSLYNQEENLNPAQRFRYIFQGIQPDVASDFTTARPVCLHDICPIHLVELWGGLSHQDILQTSHPIGSNFAAGWKYSPKTNLHMQYFLLTLLAILTRA